MAIIPNKYAVDSDISLNIRGDTISPLYELEEYNQNKTIFFPLNLAEIDHWVSFRIHKHEFLRSNDFPIDSSLCSIFLPMPSSLSTQYEQNYSAQATGPLGAQGASLGKYLRNNPNVLGALADESTRDGAIQSIADNVQGISAGDISKAAIYYGFQVAESEVGAALAGALALGKLGALGGLAAQDAFTAARGAAGIARNPHMAILYEAPSFRSHSFSYKFVARNHKESEIIQAIISKFKYYQAAGMLDGENGHFFDYPEQFDIDFHYPRYLYNIGPSVLRSFTVNYHSENQALYFNTPSTQTDGGSVNTDKAPVSITITMEFQETFILTKERIHSQNR